MSGCLDGCFSTAATFGTSVKEFTTGGEGASRRWRWPRGLIIVHLSEAESRSCARPACSKQFVRRADGVQAGRRGETFTKYKSQGQSARLQWPGKPSVQALQQRRCCHPDVRTQYNWCLAGILFGHAALCLSGRWRVVDKIGQSALCAEFERGADNCRRCKGPVASQHGAWIP